MDSRSKSFGIHSQGIWKLVKDFRQGTDWVIFCFLRISMAALWGMVWKEERMEAERWLWVVIKDQVRDLCAPNCPVGGP